MSTQGPHTDCREASRHSDMDNMNVIEADMAVEGCRGLRSDQARHNVESGRGGITIVTSMGRE